MNYLLLSKLLSILSILLLLACMLVPIRKTTFSQRHPFILVVFKHHTLYGILLLIITLFHGILAGNQPGMITGKIAWMVLLLLIIFAIPKNKMKSSIWKKIHVIISVLLCLIIIYHCFIHLVIWLLCIFIYLLSYDI